MTGVIERATESAAAHSEERFHLLSCALPVGVFYSDAYGHCIYVNKRWQDITGLRVEECIGTGWYSMIEPSERDRVIAEWEAKRGEPEAVIEFQIVNRKGEHRWVCLRTAPMRDRRNMSIGHAGTLEDITLRHEMEVALAKARDEAFSAARMKTSFLANMSHEIRTPMNGIIGMANLLLETPLNPEQQDYAETIRSSGDSLLTILNDILDFSKIEAGKLAFEVVEFNLREMMESTLELLAVRAHSKGIDLACHLPANIPVRLKGDPGRMRQVLTNLVSNGIKFTHAGEVLVEVSLEECGETEVLLRFEVRDTGIGIAADDLKNLFQPFSQAEEATTRKYGGTGLGLAISKQLVEMMHGSIGVESEAGAGSNFWFTVRLGRQGGAAEPARLLPAASDARMLVVDDNPNQRRIIEGQLAGMGMACASVGGANEALAALRSAATAGFPFTVAIVDMGMPGMDGLELARAVRKDPDLNRTRVVMLTCLSHRMDSCALREAGVAEQLPKPVKQSRLFDTLSSLLGGRVTPADGEAASTSGGKASNSLPQSLRILLADDSAVNRKVALGQLKRLDFHVDSVANGREVLSALEKTSYDVILMDMEMPELDGCETTRLIREAEANGTRRHGRPIHIIAMTANAMAGDRERCLEAGMNDYVSKPVRGDVLKAALQNWTASCGLGADVTSAAADPMEPAEPLPPKVAPVAAAGLQASPVDLGRLGDLAANDPNEIRDLTTFYLHQTEGALENLRAAIHSGDAAAVGQIAHKLAGSSATCGMTLLVGPLRTLEAQGKNGSLDASPAVLAEVFEAMERTQSYLSEYLLTLPS